MTTARLSSTLSLVALTMLALLQGTPAGAVSKVWVSNAGGDGNPCTITSPCATFQRAHDVVADGGEIGVLTPGDYGATAVPRLFISKSVNVTNDGAGEAAILNTNVANPAIYVSGNLGDVVGLRGLVLEGVGLGASGLQIDLASAVHVQNCVIRNFQAAGSSFGIFMAANSGAQSLFLSDTIIFNNGSGTTSAGILLSAQISGSIKAVLNRVQLENNVIGLHVSGFSGPGNVRATVRDSAIVGNAGNGIQVSINNGAASFAFVERSTLANNAGTGLQATGVHAVILVSDSTITKNGTGVNAAAGGQLISFGNNRNANNIGAEGVATGLFGLF